MVRERPIDAYDKDQECADMLWQCMIIGGHSGNYDKIWTYIVEMAHLFQRLHGKAYYEYSKDYDNIYSIIRIKVNFVYDMNNRKAIA